MMPSPIMPTRGGLPDDTTSPGAGDGAVIAADAARAPNSCAVKTIETYQRVLARACAIAGWLHGREPIPSEVFLRAADIVLSASFSSALSSASSLLRRAASH
jgi:hypothetical protein